MKTVGIRALKYRLSEYIRMVRSGEPVLVTDRGEIVAELRSPGEAARTEEPNPVLEAIARRGNVTIGAPNRPVLYPPLPRMVPKGIVKRWLDEERGEH